MDVDPFAALCIEDRRERRAALQQALQSVVGPGRRGTLCISESFDPYEAANATPALRDIIQSAIDACSAVRVVTIDSDDYVGIEGYSFVLPLFSGPLYDTLEVGPLLDLDDVDAKALVVFLSRTPAAVRVLRMDIVDYPQEDTGPDPDYGSDYEPDSDTESESDPNWHRRVGMPPAFQPLLLKMTGLQRLELSYDTRILPRHADDGVSRVLRFLPAGLLLRRLVLRTRVDLPQLLEDPTAARHAAAGRLYLRLCAHYSDVEPRACPSFMLNRLTDGSGAARELRLGVCCDAEHPPVPPGSLSADGMVARFMGAMLPPPRRLVLMPDCGPMPLTRAACAAAGTEVEDETA